MNNIERDLAALGDTIHEVATCLAHLNIKGIRSDSNHCPIFYYLKSKGYRVLGVSIQGISLGAPSYRDYVVPSAIGRFIYHFDRGLYPELEDKS
jgi:hypothetical protein